MGVIAEDGISTFVSLEDATLHDIDISDMPDMSAPPIFRQYFGKFGESVPGPQAFLVETYPPNSKTAAHFHSTDQFQIFLPSAGAWYQRTEVHTPLLHYSDAYTTYGPFGTGEAPLGLYTLRRQASEVTGFMPRDRDKLVRRGRRNVHVDLGPAMERVEGPGTSSIETLIEPHEDGLAAYLVSAGTDVEVCALPPDHPEATAQYLWVLDGQALCRGRQLRERCLGWRTLDTPAPTFTSGRDSGFRLLVMQFPRLYDEGLTSPKGN